VADTREGLLRSLRELPRPVWWLFAGSFVNRFGSFVSLFLVLYLVERGFSVAEAGSGVAAYGVGGLGAATLGGYLADRLGRRNTIALSMFSAAAAAMALSQVGSLWSIFALTALFGMASELYRPASAALMADLVPPERRLVAFAGYRLAINAGYAFGPAVAGFLAERSFFWLFVGEAATSAALGVVALFSLPEGVRTRRSDEPPGEAVRAIRNDRPFLLFLLASVVAGFVYFQSGTALPLHVRASGLSTAVYGVLISINGLLIVVAELAVTSYVRRFTATRAIAVGVAVTGLGFGLTAVANAAVPLALTVVVWTIGEMVAGAMSWAYVAELAPVRLRGRYSGAFGLTFAMSHILAPAVGARLFAWSPAGLWLICAALALVAAGIIVRLPSRRVEPVPKAPDVGPEVPGVER
jgi:MFS family permease